MNTLTWKVILFWCLFSFYFLFASMDVRLSLGREAFIRQNDWKGFSWCLKAWNLVYIIPLKYILSHISCLGARMETESCLIWKQSKGVAGTSVYAPWRAWLVEEGSKHKSNEGQWFTTYTPGSTERNGKTRPDLSFEGKSLSQRRWQQAKKTSHMYQQSACCSKKITLSRHRKLLIAGEAEQQSSLPFALPSTFQDIEKLLRLVTLDSTWESCSILTILTAGALPLC